MKKLKIITGPDILTIKKVEEVMLFFPDIEYDIFKILLPRCLENDITSLSEALLSENGDIIIYSARHVPYPLPSGMEIIALTEGIAKSVGQGSLLNAHSLEGQIAILSRTENNFIKELFSSIDSRNDYGKVYIAGFGPGDPDLLTVKALRVLEEADIIFHDCLLNKEYLDTFKGEKVCSGKRKNNHEKEQDEINELLYQAALSGKKVVRIKGGDPLIFGRGGEEFAYLKKRFIDVEIIPGITSALAGAAIAGIPLTQRGVSSSVAFCTGHPEGSIQIPDTDTVVYYMSASNLHIIVKRMIESGRSANTGVAIMENISMPEQRILTGTLNDILEKSRTYNSPLLVIVGNAVKLNYLIKESVNETANE